MRRDALSVFRVCGQSTASMDRVVIEPLRARVRAEHAEDVVLESCQRIEAYGRGACSCDSELQLRGMDAVRHLAEVAAGLHSAVLGEEQILGQVRAAFADADGVTGQAAKLAVAVARELRRETRFDSHAGHLLDRGLRVAEVEPGGTLLVVGAGAMGRLVAARGIELGFADVILAGRSRPVAEVAGTRWVPLSTMRDLGSVGVIAGCLGSGAATLVPESTPTAQQLVLDLGTPRNFEEDGGWPRLLTIADLLADDLGRPHARARRAALTESLCQLLERRLAMATEDANSGVGTLRKSVEGIRQREIARIQRLHPEIAPEVVDTITRGLVNQILHTPSKRLREIGDAELERQLVGLFA